MPTMPTTAAMRTTAAPAASDASNQNGSREEGDEVGSRLEQVRPRREEELVEGEEGRLEGDGEHEREGQRHRADASSGDEERPSSASALAQEEPCDDGDRGCAEGDDSEDPTRTATSCMCERSSPSSSGPAPGNPASKAPSVQMSPRRSPVTRSTSSGVVSKAPATS